MGICKRKKGGATGERDRKKVKLNKIAKSCQNIKNFFKLNNEYEDDPDDPASCMVNVESVIDDFKNIPSKRRLIL